ncbi:MAG: FAD-binding oxidoreductase [Gammaproteobacteria bacterium]|nr:FAD-binding oxidoreductase [Gammaproteobacteria bacterium]
MGVAVNDLHSELNASEAAEVVSVDSLQAIRAGVARARVLGVPVAVAGGRYAMGGQQFCNGGLLLDTRALNRVLHFDFERGLVEVEAGIQWPDLIEYLDDVQAGLPRPWTIAQKQTGADRISVGGTISANAHGRGLTMGPFVSDVVSLLLVNANGETIECSRGHNIELFRLVVGGYGLFGCIYAATLRLVPRRTLERVVELAKIDDLVRRFNDRIGDGFLYGDFQFATDDTSEDFLRTGVFSCYRPVEREQPPPADQQVLSRDDWRRLISLAHTDKRLAFKLYSEHYLATSGQIYSSDQHQLADYEDGYHRRLDEALGASFRATEMISELFVPRERLADFMVAAAEDFRKHQVDVIYGTIRLIERDEVSFLAWASKPWACVIFNLHTVHTPNGIAHSADAFRRLIDLAIERGGNYYLTYHRWATREQVERCYPQLRQFLELKRVYDPEEHFQSDWYRHYRGLLFDE